MSISQLFPKPLIDAYGNLTVWLAADDSKGNNASKAGTYSAGSTEGIGHKALKKLTLLVCRAGMAGIGYSASRFLNINPLVASVAGSYLSIPSTLLAAGTVLYLQGGRTIIQQLFERNISTFIGGIARFLAGAALLAVYDSVTNLIPKGPKRDSYPSTGIIDDPLKSNIAIYL